MRAVRRCVQQLELDKVDDKPWHIACAHRPPSTLPCHRPLVTRLAEIGPAVSNA